MLPLLGGQSLRDQPSHLRNMEFPMVIGDLLLLNISGDDFVFRLGFQLGRAMARRLVYNP